MKHTFSVLVENRAGVLSRITGLFSRRGFNIDSLAVGVTEDKSVSRITIVADGNEHTVEQVEKQLNKLIDVIRVKTIRPGELVSRDMLLIKVVAGPKQRSEVADIAKIVGADVIDISPSTLTLQLADASERLDLLEELVRPYGIREMARTGVVALEKGGDEFSVKK